MIQAFTGTLLLMQAVSSGWDEAPSLPRPVTNNVVAALERADGTASVFSFFGAPEAAAQDGSSGPAFRWDVETAAWEEIRPVPGPPRVGSTALGVRGRVYVLGGRAAGADGSERAVPSVDVYDPETDTWSRGAPMPVPVADAVAGVWRDSLVFVVSGRHDEGAVSDVQVYDPRADRWAPATSVPGTPVFGHAGAIARDVIVYVDGARAVGGAPGGGAGAMEPSSWRGDIDPARPTTIRWTRLPDHPGPPLFGGAAGVVGTRVLFFGGSEQPHDRSGLGADGMPANPLALGLSYDVAAASWRHVRVPPTPTMDHRALARAGGYLLLVGGMEPGARATQRVRRASVVGLLAG